MITKRNKIRTFLLYAGDLLATGLAFLCAYWFRGVLPQDSSRILFPFSWYANLFWAVVPIWSLLFYLLGLYRYWRGPGFWKETWAVLKAVFLALFFLGFFVFAAKYQFVSRIFLLSFAGFDVILVTVFRLFLRKLIPVVSRHSETALYILIVGVGEDAREMARSVVRHKDLGLRILGFLSPEESNFPASVDGHPVLGSARDLPHLLEKEVIDEVVFTVPQDELKKMENLLLACEERGITTRVVLNFFPHVISRTHLEELDGLPLLTFSTTPANDLLLSLRRIFDIFGSLVLIVLLSPLFLVITLLIRLDSPGPALYRQVRCGLNGRKFTLYKFRSMFENAEERKEDLARFNLMNGPVFKMKNDPRITRAGRLLRKTSLDELPQMLNVLRGSMSFVGPRPLPAEEVERCKGWERRRLSMKPGITGLWQVSGRNHVDFQEWMRLDLEYIDNWSIWLDMKIVLRTIPAILLGKGAM